MAKDELVYNGVQLEWSGHGKWKATSGVGDYQTPEHQSRAGEGPIPEGLYDVSLTLGNAARPKGVKKPEHSVIYEPAFAIQEMPTNFLVPGERIPFSHDNAWGCHRVGLKVVRFKDPEKCGHRYGFYIHDSTKGYTAGCIETEPEFFLALIPFAQQQQKQAGGLKVLKLLVDYTGQTKTNGGTYVKP